MAKTIAQYVLLNEYIQRWLPAFATVLTALALALPTPGFAQLAGPAAPARVVMAAKPVLKPATARPFWAELTPMQQQALKPLAMSWDTVSEAQKRKWLEISKNYPNLSPVDQTTLHSRMNEWVALSPLQRAEARLNFAKTKELSTKLTPEEKKAKWQIYQALSPEEKTKLAAKAPPRPVGAALAVKPVAPQKLTEVLPPGTKPDAKTVPRTVPVQTTILPQNTGEAVSPGISILPTN